MGTMGKKRGVPHGGANTIEIKLFEAIIELSGADRQHGIGRIKRIGYSL
jgi:hypothetical protein